MLTYADAWVTQLARDLQARMTVQRPRLRQMLVRADASTLRNMQTAAQQQHLMLTHATPARLFHLLACAACDISLVTAAAATMRLELLSREAMSAEQGFVVVSRLLHAVFEASNPPQSIFFLFFPSSIGDERRAGLRSSVAPPPRYLRGKQPPDIHMLTYADVC